MDPYCIHTELIYQLAEERMWDLRQEAKARRPGVWNASPGPILTRSEGASSGWHLFSCSS